MVVAEAALTAFVVRVELLYVAHLGGVLSVGRLVIVSVPTWLRSCVGVKVDDPFDPS